MQILQKILKIVQNKVRLACENVLETKKQKRLDYNMVSMKDIAKTMQRICCKCQQKLLMVIRISAKETRQLILKTASEMGYLPNSSARALKTRRSYNLGVLFVDEAMRWSYS